MRVHLSATTGAARQQKQNSPPQYTGIVQMRTAPEDLLDLRRLALRICGDAFCFMRVAIGANQRQCKVGLCVQVPVLEVVVQAIQRDLPEVEIDIIL